MMWIQRTEDNNALVLFIHGIWGDRWKTWAQFPERLQQKKDRTTKSYDIYTYRYSSKLAGPQPSLTKEPLQDLDALLIGVQEQYDTVVIIAHSQGGLLAKLYVLHKLRAGQGRGLRVDLILTLRTPHFGLKVLSPLYLLSKCPGIKHLLWLKQLSEAASISPNIRQLKDGWNAKYICDKPCEAAPNRRYILSYTIGGGDWLVWASNAAGYPIDRKDRRGFAWNHSLKTEEIEQCFYEYLEAHGDPEIVRSQIKEIRASDIASQIYRERCRPLLVGIVAQKRQQYTPGQRAAVVETLLTGFLEEKLVRPLRALTTLETAIARYATNWLRANTDDAASNDHN